MTASPQFSPSFLNWLKQHFPDAAPKTNFPADFLAASKQLDSDEGGYTRDRGGETNFGVSKNSYPDLDIANLTHDDAVQIRWFDWWEKYGYTILPEAIAGKVFNIAYNMGPAHAATCLQRACRACGYAVGETGHIGEQTRGACRLIAERDALALLAAFRSEVAGWYRLDAALDESKARDLKGWINRAYE